MGKLTWLDSNPAGALIIVALGVALGVGFILALIDMRTRRVPNRIVLPAIPATLVPLAVAACVTGSWPRFLQAVLAALGTGVVFCLGRMRDPPAVGGGDVKLAVLLSLPLGWLDWRVALLAPVVAVTASGLVALVLVASGRVGRSASLPFGPWLVFGAAASLAGAQGGLVEALGLSSF